MIASSVFIDVNVCFYIFRRLATSILISADADFDRLSSVIRIDPLVY